MYNNISEVREYLKKFDEILCQMADEMLSQEITNIITIDFIKCMIPHHKAAIYMSNNLLKYTNYKPIQQIANEIIQMQTRGIEQMSTILKTTNGYTNSEFSVAEYMRRYYKITRNMISQMRNSRRTNNINLNFTYEMIPHHKGAIEMCNNLLKYKIDPRLREVAQSIIQEQSKGVMELEEIRERLM